MEYHTFDIVRKSLELAWKHKILWIFALMIAGIGGGGGGGSSTNNTGHKETSKESRTETKVVLGTQTTTLGEEVVESKEQNISAPEEKSNKELLSIYLKLRSILKNTYPMLFLVILCLVFFLFILYSISIALIQRSWATAATIEGTFMGVENPDSTLDKIALAKFGTENIWKLVKFKLLALAYIILGFLLIATLPLIAVLIPFLKTIAVILSALLFLPAFLAFLLFIFSLAVSTRLILKDSVDPKAAIMQGYKLMLRNISSFLKLAFVNFGVTILITIIVLSVIGTAVVSALIMFTSISQITYEFLTYAVYASLAPVALIAAIIFVSVFKGYVTTYSEFTWTFLFKKMKTTQGVTNGQ